MLRTSATPRTPVAELADASSRLPAPALARADQQSWLRTQRAWLGVAQQWLEAGTRKVKLQHEQGQQAEKALAAARAQDRASRCAAPALPCRSALRLRVRLLRAASSAENVRIQYTALRPQVRGASCQHGQGQARDCAHPRQDCS